MLAFFGLRCRRRMLQPIRGGALQRWPDETSAGQEWNGPVVARVCEIAGEVVPGMHTRKGSTEAHVEVGAPYRKNNK